MATDWQVEYAEQLMAINGLGRDGLADFNDDWRQYEGLPSAEMSELIDWLEERRRET